MIVCTFALRQSHSQSVAAELGLTLSHARLTINHLFLLMSEWTQTNMHHALLQPYDFIQLCRQLRWSEILVEPDEQRHSVMEATFSMNRKKKPGSGQVTMLGLVYHCQPSCTWKTERVERQLASDEQIVRRFHAPPAFERRTDGIRWERKSKIVFFGFSLIQLNSYVAGLIGVA